MLRSHSTCTIHLDGDHLKRLTTLTFALLTLFSASTTIAEDSFQCQANTANVTSILELRTIAADHNSIVVDIRSENEFRKSRARNSVHILPAFLRTKLWLREKSVILIGASVDPELPTLAHSLREKGFSSVTIVPYGLYGWKLSGGEIDGEQLSITEPLKISAQEFVYSALNQKWHVFVTEPEAFPELPAQVMPPTIEKLSSHPNSTGLGQRATDAPTIVIVSDINAVSNISATGATDVNNQGIRTPLFILDGGTEALRTFLSTNAQMLKNFKHTKLTCG